MNAKKIRSLLPYLIIPLVIVGIAFYSANGSMKKEKPKYYEIVSKFDNNEISSFSLNLSSGALTYVERGENTTAQKYTVPNVELFVADIHDTVTKYNLANK